MSAKEGIISGYRIYGGGCVLAGAITYLWGHPLIDGNKDATSVIVTVFSILAGFLIAIMTLLGDQSVIPGSWRISELKRRSIKVKLIRQKWLFYLYLMTLVLIFASSLVEKKYPEVSDLLERIYFSCSVTAFLLSFRLPSTLMQVQMERVEAIVAARKAAAPKADQ